MRSDSAASLPGNEWRRDLIEDLGIGSLVRVAEAMHQRQGVVLNRATGDATVRLMLSYSTGGAPRSGGAEAER